MKNFDFNALGVEEMELIKLIEVNGGEQPIPNPGSGLVATLVQMVYYFYTEIIPIMVADQCKRAAKDGYVMYADIGHR
jgi:hypothetical protein